MKRALFIIILLSSSYGHAFTCVSSNCVRFPTNKVTINFANNACTGTGFTKETLRAYTISAMNEFWNTVPTSSLEVNIGTEVAVDVSSDTSAGVVAGKAGLNTILIGCNGNTTAFPSAGTKAGEGSISCNSSGCRGGVIIRTTDNVVSGMSAQEVITLIAHEVGHALGLGHTEESNAVMYQSVGNFKSQEALHQDDRTGISYLYSNEKELGGLLGACGTVSFNNDDGPGPGPLFFTFLIGQLFLLALAIRRKNQA